MFKDAREEDLELEIEDLKRELEVSRRSKEANKKHALDVVEKKILESYKIHYNTFNAVASSYIHNYETSYISTVRSTIFNLSQNPNVDPGNLDKLLRDYKSELNEVGLNDETVIEELMRSFTKRHIREIVEEVMSEYKE